MKFLALVLMITASTFAIADHYEKDISFYNGFAGTGDRMRKETIFLVRTSGQREQVAQRILVDSTNELREIFTSERPRENTTPENQAVWDRLSTQARPSAAARGSQLNDCIMSDDELSISCPSGLYVKSSSVNDSLRSPPAKERPSRIPARPKPTPVNEE